MSGTLLTAAAAFSLIASVTAAPVAAAPPTDVDCRPYPAIPVSLRPDAPKSQHIWGELCARPADLVDGHAVQLLLHGAYYNHAYWNSSYGDGSYSYARNMAARGVPTFAIDRIGQGRSTRPQSAEITVRDDAFVVHQIVQALKAGTVGNTRFGPVVLAGHSVGSIVAWQEAAEYRDVQGLIITGMLHVVPVNAGILTAGSNFRPARLDPKFQGENLDPGYWTTAEGSRGQLFHHEVDPGIVAWDEANKDASSAVEFAGAFTYATSDLTRSIRVPVLIIQAEKDFLLCGTGGADCSSAKAIEAREAPYYSPEACLQVVQVPNAGHSIALSRNHEIEEKASAHWSDKFFGTGGQPPRTGGCG
ncbi:lysophospholipase [Nocardia sp. CDC159]|uniref:Lysophospholipase n=1 Tax=Nocardia pulmonis TaxID=2951408 RepID=A0A9X2E4K8_9NOCA|nr:MULTISPECIES: alpha/beta fold hydrolase [Nocardia]MCM6773719.1 lysophospholipase [Nocardia pulmonis]MCM6786606.1 lysophospholipase [Nocardia sp. CDC159]